MMRQIKVKQAMLVGMCALSAFASGQSPPSYSLEVYFSQGSQVSYVSSVKFGELTDLFGLGEDLEIRTFAGVDGNSDPLFGFSVGKRWRIANEFSVWTGVGVQAKEGRPIGTGLSLGLVYTLKI